MNSLEETANRQAIWSQTADAYKRRLDRIRWLTLVFSVMGALLATIASQLKGEALQQPRLVISVIGAAMLAFVSILTARMMAKSEISTWIRARAASEALKREGYKFCAQAAPYQVVETRNRILNDERSKIETDVNDIIGSVVNPTKPSSLPLVIISPAGYISKRILPQIDFFNERATVAKGTASLLRKIEFGLAATATILTGIMGAVGNAPFGVNFDFVALTAVFTTIAGAVVSHLEAARYDYIVTTYRATARRLTDQKAQLGPIPEAPSDEWSGFVVKCEGILASENASWIAKWGKDASIAKTE